MCNFFQLGKQIIDYGKPRPIALLEDVLNAMKGSGKLMLLEVMKICYPKTVHVHRVYL